MEITFLTVLYIPGTHYPTMLSGHLPLVLLCENSKILGYHSLLRRPLNYIPGILFIFYLFFDFTGVISMRY